MQNWENLANEVNYNNLVIYDIVMIMNKCLQSQFQSHKIFEFASVFKEFEKNFFVHI